jgi:hypothetical protein
VAWTPTGHFTKSESSNAITAHAVITPVQHDNRNDSGAVRKEPHPAEFSPHFSDTYQHIDNNSSWYIRFDLVILSFNGYNVEMLVEYDILSIQGIDLSPKRWYGFNVTPSTAPKKQ